MTTDHNSAGQAVRHAIADAINRARYWSPEPGLEERGVDEEDPRSREYAFRLADAAIAALSTAPDPAPVEAGGGGVRDWKTLAIGMGAHLELLEAHCAVQTGKTGTAHAAEGQQFREAGKAFVSMVRAELDRPTPPAPAGTPSGASVEAVLRDLRASAKDTANLPSTREHCRVAADLLASLTPAATPVSEGGSERETLLAALRRIKLRLHFMGWPAEAFWNAGTAEKPHWTPDWRYEIALIENALNGSPITMPEKPTDTTPFNQLPTSSPAGGAVREAFPDDATPEMIAAALKVDWSNEDEEAVAHNVWHAMRAAMPATLSSPATPEAALAGGRDRLATIIQGAIAEHCSIDAIEMEIDGTGPASYKAADRILAALSPAPAPDQKEGE